ncbi:MAG: regulatory iron-sulfur-containing complex subunit RicT [Acidobacteriota bacterium]
MSCASCSGGTTPSPRLARVTLAAGVPGQLCTVSDGVKLEAGEWYVVGTEDGERLGRLVPYEMPILRQCPAKSLGTLLRRAVTAEMEQGARVVELEREAIAFCRRRVRELDLPLRPVGAVVPLNREAVYLTFAAEERVDLRELLRDLSRHLRRRVELRQVGVRDQAKLAGGWGPCGRALCCSSYMLRFNSITIRMAKAQRLSLNPSRISGMCGRLMCCLSYEMPPPGSRESSN